MKMKYKIDSGQTDDVVEIAEQITAKFQLKMIKALEDKNHTVSEKFKQDLERVAYGQKKNEWNIRWLC